MILQFLQYLIKQVQPSWDLLIIYKYWKYIFIIITFICVYMQMNVCVCTIPGLLSSLIPIPV